jgi:SET domain
MNTTEKSITSIVGEHGIASVLKNEITGEQSLVSNQIFQPGDCIATFSASTVSLVPTYLTVQTGEEIHITLNPEFLQYINHSCDPNVFFDTTSMQLIALKNIFSGDEFVFFYPSTEWKMIQPFQCYCNAANCLKNIGGAFSLSPESIGNYRFTDFIQQKLALQSMK